MSFFVIMFHVFFGVDGPVLGHNVRVLRSEIANPPTSPFFFFFFFLLLLSSSSNVTKMRYIILVSISQFLGHILSHRARMVIKVGNHWMTWELAREEKRYGISSSMIPH
jgi:hypothetical protein